MNKQAILFSTEFVFSDQNLRSIFDSFPFALAITTLEGKILMFNNVAVQLTGYSRDELLNGGDIRNLYYDPNDRLRIMAELKKGKIIKDEKILIKLKDGQPYPVFLSISLLQSENEMLLLGTINERSVDYKVSPEILGVVLDDSGNKEENDPQKRLVKSEERLEFALTGADLGLWDWNIETDRVIINTKWASMLGYEVSEVAANLSKREMMIHPEDKKSRITALNNHLSGKTPFYASEYRIKTKDGTWRWVLDRGKITKKKSDGTPIRMTGTHLDIHYRKEAERKLVELTKSLQQSNYGLKQFAYITSHNLKSPVNNISSLLSLVDQSRISADNKEMLSKINQLASTLNDTLDDLTKIISVSDGSSQETAEVLNFKSVIDSVLVSLGPMVQESNASITLDLKIQEIRYSKSFLYSILLNLIGNAIKYRSAEKQPEIILATRKENDNILLTVQDNGLGIDLSIHKDKVFNLYNRFHNHVEGKGMGLFLIKSQVESLGGSVDLKSKPGEGSTFIIRLAEQKPTVSSQAL
jgi:PAS domain S-box-containing protein